LHPIGAGGRDRRDDQTQAIRWYLYDGLGSVLGEVDTAGNLTASRKYGVYGLVRAGDNGTSRHKFVGSLGHTSEDETGLIYMRARWMDPALGRFISEDPACQGGNWFSYCAANPVNLQDRTGRAYDYVKPLLELLTAAFVVAEIAAKNAPFKRVLQAWLVGVGVESMGFIAARLGAGGLGGAAILGGTMAMLASVAAAPLEATGPWNGAAFWGGYSALLLMTYVLLDYEVALSTGGGFADWWSRK